MSEGKAALDKIKTELEGHTIGILGKFSKKILPEPYYHMCERAQS